MRSSGGGGLETKIKMWGGVRENVWGGGVCEKNQMCGGASEIFSSLSPPEDFKWNSPEEYFEVWK